MKLPKQLPQNSILKQKRDIAIDVCISIKVAPQMYKLLKIDRMYALRFFVIMRSFLFDWSKPFRENDKTAIKYFQTVSDFDLIGSLNLRLFENEKLLNRKPKNEEQFAKVLNEMVNIFILFITESAVDKNLRLKFASEYLKFVEKLELVFGPMENEDLQRYIKKLDSQSHKLKKTEVVHKPDCAEKDKEILTNAISSEEDVINTPTNLVKEEPLSLNTENEFLTRKETAKFYKISLPTLWRWEKKGSIPRAIRIGGKVFWRKSDILKDLEKREDENYKQ